MRRWRSPWTPWLFLGAGTLLFVLGLGLPQGFEEGVRLFEEGKFQEAHRAFQERDRALGDRAPASLLFNRALAALRVGANQDAEISAERAAARGGPGGYALRDFILGNASYQRAARAAREARLPEGGPRALDRAILGFQTAIQHWSRALEKRPNWPQAAHNIALAEKRLEQLNKRPHPQAKKAKTPAPQQKGTPILPKTRSSHPLSGPSPLSPRQLQALLQTLEQNERAKWTLRRKKRQQRPPTAGKAW
ncbi:MAG TPA: hypothetical protein ENK02_14180 [Planctomycetes bacterium]|nr:hypothetical protein [Planctomycetota bacterium]